MSHILVALAAIFQDHKGRTHLVEHKKKSGGYRQGKWIYPREELEYSEEIRGGIKKEVKEETNLEVELSAPRVPFDGVAKSDEEITLHAIYVDYIARLPVMSLV